MPTESLPVPYLYADNVTTKKSEATSMHVNRYGISHQQTQYTDTEYHLALKKEEIL